MKYNGIYFYGHMPNEESFVYSCTLDTNTSSLRKDFSESFSKSMSSKATSAETHDGSKVIQHAKYYQTVEIQNTTALSKL